MGSPYLLFLLSCYTIYCHNVLPEHGWQYTPSRPCSPWHVPPAAFQASLGYNPFASGNETFCVVRDPFSRAVSEVLYAYSRGEFWEDGRLCHSEEINKLVNAMLDRVAPFVATIADWDGRLHVGDEHAVEDCHWLPQVAYTNGPGVSPCDHVLHLDTLTEDWTALMSNWPADDPTAPIDASELLQGATNTSPCPNVTVGVLSDRSRQRIAHLYAADFEVLRYATQMVADDELEQAILQVRRDGQKRPTPRRDRGMGLRSVPESAPVIMYQ